VVYRSSFSDWCSIIGKVPLDITGTKIWIGGREIARRNGELAVATLDASRIINEAVQAFKAQEDKDGAQAARVELESDHGKMAETLLKEFQAEVAKRDVALLKEVDDKLNGWRMDASERVARREALRTKGVLTPELVQAAAHSDCGKACCFSEEPRTRCVFVGENGDRRDVLDKCLQQGAVVDIAACTGRGVLVILEWPGDKEE
jgi:hypothetical protein